jgi:hypothetical protein
MTPKEKAVYLFNDYYSYLKSNLMYDEEARQDAEYAEYIMRTTTQKIAVNKIKRNKIFNLGLGLKLSMRNCGMY